MSKPVKTGKRKRLESTGEKSGSDAFSFTVTHSSPLSNGLVECDYEIKRASPEQSADGQVIQACPGAEEESGQIHTTKCESEGPDCCPGLRKTPPRSSKGCGRVCTACPCGTKVGGVADNSASKPREKPNPCSGFNSSKNESDRDATPVDRLADSVSSSKNGNSASGSSGDEMTPVSKDVEGTLPTAAVSTCRPEGQPKKADTCSSSSKCTQDKTWETSTSSQLDADTQKPSALKEVKMVSSSVQKLSYTSYKIPSELYSSVLLDPEEIKRQERIKRLKDLLQEKEAALEKLRKSM